MEGLVVVVVLVALVDARNLQAERLEAVVALAQRQMARHAVAERKLVRRLAAA